jgi:hypothetical protein
VPTTIYHSTSIRNAAAILTDGFRDATGSFGFATTMLTGVFFADEPVDENDGAASSEAIVAVDVPNARTLEQFEIIEDLKGFREWCLPAVMVNEWPRRLCS